MAKKLIPNPWNQPKHPWDHKGKTHYEVDEKPCATHEGFEFYTLPASVLAVKGGKAITECVTVNGAKRHLLQKGLIKAV